MIDTKIEKMDKTYEELHENQRNLRKYDPLGVESISTYLKVIDIQAEIINRRHAEAVETKEKCREKYKELTALKNDQMTLKEHNMLISDQTEIAWRYKNAEKLISLIQKDSSKLWMNMIYANRIAKDYIEKATKEESQ